MRRSAVYADKVVKLEAALDEPAIRDEAGNVLRSLNSKIILNPRGEGGVDAVLDGDLATILAFPDGAREKRERPGAAAPRRFRCGCGGRI